MKIKKDFVLRNIAGENVVVAEGADNVDFNKMICLNESAAFVWSTLQQAGEFTVEQAVKALCAEYDVKPSVAERDIRELLDNWAHCGLLEA